jgi:hypothetical protein
MRDKNRHRRRAIAAVFLRRSVRRRKAKINKNSKPAKPDFGIFVFLSHSLRPLYFLLTQFRVDLREGFSFIYARRFFFLPFLKNFNMRCNF